MKVRTCLMIAVIIALASGLLAARSVHYAEHSSNPLRFDVDTDKEQYLVGEEVHLNFKVVNQSDRQVSLYPGSTVWDGYIDVFVAYQGEDFRRYRGPMWGVRDAIYKEPLILKPGEAFESEAVMLCNPVLETSHLNDAAAKRAQKRENLVQGNYVLTKPGYYFVKAILLDPKSDNIIESSPVRSFADRPQGDDLDVWNKIKDRRDYAFFIQTGSVGNVGDQHSKKVANDLQEIVTLHPTNKYADKIRKSLNEYREVVNKFNSDKQE